MLAGVDYENGRPPEPDELPGEVKTVNQIVAWNIAYYRRAAGLTQEELGELIGGRGKRAMSADETSWGGGHTREFNASELAGLARALDVPIIAFFLPPEDDGVTVRYQYRPHDGAGLFDMGDLMSMVMPDSESESRTMDAYRRRLVAATGQYMGPSWTDDLDRWMTSMTPREIRAEEAEDLRADREALWRIAAKLSRMITAYEKEDDQ
jgi:transcriptional regulator with XRE-family HTH domain